MKLDFFLNFLWSFWLDGLYRGYWLRILTINWLCWLFIPLFLFCVLLQVFRNPISPRVGELLGVRNMLSGRVAKVGILATVEAAGMVMEVEVSGLALDQPVIAGVRPRDLQAFPEPTGNALLVREVDAGTRRTLVLQLQGGSHVYAELTREMDLRLGQSTLPSQWQVSVAPGGGFVWPANGTK